MMNKNERIESMKVLPQHIGEIVSVTYMNTNNQPESIIGKLKKVIPYSNLVLAHLEKIPKELQDMKQFKGYKITKSVSGIPFIGLPDSIMSITAQDGKILYDNEHIRPSYNPHFFPTQNEAGRLRTGDNYKAGEAYAKYIRILSFGNK